MSKLQALVDKYPAAFQTDDTRYAYPRYGFEIKEGWADLIEPIVKFIWDWNTAPANKDNKIEIRQIKQKYAALRFYTSIYTDGLSLLIEQAERESARTCEDCGKEGTVRLERGWRYVSCYDHRRNTLTK
jgi:hypothetical protein